MLALDERKYVEFKFGEVLIIIAGGLLTFGAQQNFG